MKLIRYTNGDNMPALGLGTWKSAPGEVYNAVVTAIKSGYRHIDCAPVYGNEKEIGQAISDCVANRIVTREELWITSKLWNTAHQKNEVLPALKATLDDLKLEYLDLYLIHWPVALKEGAGFPLKASNFYSLEEVPLTETWKGMEDTVKAGLVRHIGVSNFGPEHLQVILKSAEIAPEMNQVECHPYFQQDTLLNFCREHNIFLTAYSPLGSYDRSEAFKASNEPKLLDDPVIAHIANTKEVSPAQILISWALHRGISVIPKSVHAGRIAQNFAAEEIHLSDEDMKSIAALDRNFRYVTGTFWTPPGSPYTLNSLWR
ncbi:MAG: aldo/keto reductase [Flavobacteriaceae bacterium]|nr:aldo/keto reductase [Flavobacteriaceae bacterium]